MDFGRITTLTLDCYGTLVDWEAGALAALRPLLRGHGIGPSDDELVRLVHDLDGALCEPPYRPYREVLAGTVEGVAARLGVRLGPGQREVLAASLPSWPLFPDTVAALRALAGRFRLAVVSNLDDDLFAATRPGLGVTFDEVVTAEQARSYKPGRPIFELALRRLGEAPDGIAHVAEGASEVGPARSLGCATVWVRRRGRSARQLTELPDLDVPNLAALAAAVGSGGAEAR